MAKGDDSFSRYVDMLRAFHTRRFAAARVSIEQANLTVPPPPPPPPRETELADENTQSLLNSLRSASLTPQETETCLQSLTNVMTSSEDEDDARFQEVISNLNGSELQRRASLLTSNHDDHYFLEIARKKNGSIRLQNLLGKSDDVDELFCAAILRRFLHVMTDKNAHYVATKGMRVFSHEKKMAMRDQLLYHAVPLACTRYGSVTLRLIITDDDFEYCRNYLLGIVAFNAPLLSYDAYGTYVVQHVLKQSILRRTCNDIAVSLRGHYVELSFTPKGRCIVEKLLERDEETRVLVVAELLECEVDRLVRLARSVCGNFVVEKALKLSRGDLFRGLVNKLKPVLPLLRSSHRSITIAKILDFGFGTFALSLTS